MTNLTKATANGQVSFSEEEIAEHNANIIAWEAQEAEYAAGATDRAAAEARTERDSKLAETDWTQVADAPVSQEDWAAYRQLLRDVPLQAEFPITIAWPTEPE